MGKDAKLIRRRLNLSVRHTGKGCHGGNSTTGPFQLNDRLHACPTTFPFEPSPASAGSHSWEAVGLHNEHLAVTLVMGLTGCDRLTGPLLAGTPIPHIPQ